VVNAAAAYMSLSLSLSSPRERKEEKKGRQKKGMVIAGVASQPLVQSVEYRVDT